MLTDGQLSRGFPATTPYRICEQYSKHLLSREQLIDELIRFPYTPEGATDGYDSLLVSGEGAWSNVSAAHRHGLIDTSVYEEIFNRRHNLS